MRDEYAESHASNMQCTVLNRYIMQNYSSITRKFDIIHLGVRYANSNLISMLICINKHSPPCSWVGSMDQLLRIF